MILFRNILICKRNKPANDISRLITGLSMLEDGFQGMTGPGKNESRVKEVMAHLVGNNNRIIKLPQMPMNIGDE